MRKFIFTLFITLLPLFCMAQSQESIIRQIEQVSSATKSVECSFVQTKHVKLLNDKMVSYGKMYYSAPSLLRWEYTSPYTYTFILNQHQVLLKSAQRQDVVDVNNSKMFKEIVRLMMSSVVGSCLSDDTTFDVSIASVGNEWVATLLPLRRDMKQMWSRLVVHFNRSNQSVVKVEMYEPSGDYTIIELSNIRRNATIDGKLFSIN